MHPAPDQQVMNDAYDHALWLRRCQSPLDQRDRQLCDLGHYVSRLLAALEKGQENCDAVYDELKAENAKLAAWILGHCDHWTGDHACEECFPGEASTLKGFRCAVHVARKVTVKREQERRDNRECHAFIRLTNRQ